MTIDTFLEDFWPEIEPISLGEHGFEEHLARLRKQYGTQTIDEYEELAIATVTNPSEDAYRALQNFVHKTGIYVDIDTDITARSRETLRMLLHSLQDSPPFTITDLGSGCGRIIVGLTRYLTQLKHAYAIDYEHGPIQAIQENMKANDVSDKLTIIQGDYRTKEAQEQVPPAQIVLAAYCYHGLDKLAPIMNAYLAEGGRILYCTPASISCDAYPDALDQFAEDAAKSFSGRTELRFSVLSRTHFTPEEMLVIFEGVRKD